MGAIDVERRYFASKEGPNDLVLVDLAFVVHRTIAETGKMGRRARQHHYGAEIYMETTSNQHRVYVEVIRSLTFKPDPCRLGSASALSYLLD